MFGAISSPDPNPPISKPLAIAQAFCSKTANFGHLRIQPKSKQTVSIASIIAFASIEEAFQRVWSDFIPDPNPRFSKAWAIAQAFWSKTANFGPLRIHPKSTQTVRKAARNAFSST